MSKHHHNRRKFLGTTLKGCASLGLTTLYSGITNMGLINAAAAANRNPYTPKPAAGNYKALVCLLLSGGNDSYNMLVPKGTAEYNEYANVRTNLALTQNSLLALNPTSSDGKQYGVHPKLQKMRNLFESGNTAFIANIGALVAPTTLSDFQNDVNLPIGLFSHSDQQQHWQTSIPQDKNAIGWGGRLADILHTNNANNDISMNISLSGINLFQKGNQIQNYSIERQGTGSVLINDSDQSDFYNVLKRQTLDNILDQSYQNVLETAYTDVISNSKSHSIQFGAAIAGGTPINTYFRDDNLSQQFNMVAKTIAARDLLGVSNQTFFIEFGGFDTHDNFLTEHSDLMENLDNALMSFYDAMAELGLENDVTTFTISDFARKLVSNGNGADHAWGGHAMVMGGDVKGKNIYGQYPDLHLGNSLDTGSGRIIPTTSCDEYFAELALWFGASHSDINQIFPNINNFWTPTTGNYPIGFMN